MTDQFIIAGLLALLSGGITVWIARRSFNRHGGRHDFEISGAAPLIWRVRDHSVASVIEGIRDSHGKDDKPAEEYPRARAARPVRCKSRATLMPS